MRMFCAYRHVHINYVLCAYVCIYLCTLYGLSKCLYNGCEESKILYISETEERNTVTSCSYVNVCARFTGKALHIENKAENYTSYIITYVSSR